MEIQILSFGKIAEFINVKSLSLDGVSDTDMLRLHLEAIFPELKGIKYKLALNSALIQSNMPLKDGAIVAVMPPFSGG